MADWTETDHDALVDLRPRVATLEKQLEREQNETGRRLDRHDTQLDGLVATINQVEERLRQEVHAAVDPIEAHLTRQDEAQAKAVEATAGLREEVAAGRATWPQGAVVFVSAAGTFVAVVLASVLGHVRF